MINLAVIGLGNWGQRHVRSARGSERFQVVMAADPDTSQATSFAEKLNLKLVRTSCAVIACGTVSDKCWGPTLARPDERGC